MSRFIELKDWCGKPLLMARDSVLAISEADNSTPENPRSNVWLSSSDGQWVVTESVESVREKVEREDLVSAKTDEATADSSSNSGGFSLAEKLAKELLKAGGNQGRPATRIAFRMSQAVGPELDCGGFCEDALVRFFKANLPI